MIISELAKIIIVPYLWWFGYSLDQHSVDKCYFIIESQQQKRCLCTSECPYCDGKCNPCDCIYEPLPPPGPGKPMSDKTKSTVEK